MGLFRVFKKSIKFTVRSKRRFLIFLLIFAIVSTYVAFFVDTIDTMQTDEFLEQKGVVVQEIGEFTVTYSQSDRLMKDILDLSSSGQSLIEDSTSYHYIDLDHSLRILSIDVEKPWMFHHMNPSLIQTGRYPRTPDEILVPAGSSQIRNSSLGITLISDIVIGQTIEFNVNDTSIELKVVGTYDDTAMQILPDLESQLWMFMDFSKFEKIIDLYGKTLDDAYTYSMSFTVPGIVLNPTTYDAINKLNTEIKEIISNGNENSYGSWIRQPFSAPTDDAKAKSYRQLVSLGFAIVGGMILSLMFSYLISRFRRREIAVLKALGYSNASVRTSLIGEIITTSTAGFVIGLGSAQAIIFYVSDWNPLSLLRAYSLMYSFLINVVIALPGMFLVSRRILKISPAEAFRDK